MFKSFLKKVLPEHFVWWLCKVFPPKPFLDDVVRSERIVEYAWTYQHLPPAPARILDIGSSGSHFAHSLASIGYIAYALDWKDREPTHPNMLCIKSDMMQLKTGGFDAVTCISSLEHIALRVDWKEAVEQMLSFLKPGGLLLITVPCGVVAKLNGYRVFSVDAFSEADYYRMICKGIWAKTQKETVRLIKMENKDDVKSIMCAVIRKEG